MVDILTGYGYEVVIPKAQKCNGTPVLANDDYEGAKMFMAHNFNLFRHYDLDAIVVACSSCGMAPKKEIKLFIDDCKELRSFTEKIYDINEFIEKISTSKRPTWVGCFDVEMLADSLREAGTI